MNIRTITLGVRDDNLSESIPAAYEARARLQAAGYKVQELRLALSFQSIPPGHTLVSMAIDAERKALDAGFSLVSLGRIRFECMPQIADALAATRIVTCSGRIAGRDGVISQEGIRASAETIVANSRVNLDGLANFRFAAMAGVGPGYPFFPAAYHDGGSPWIAIGPETAALGHQALAQQLVQQDAMLEMPKRLEQLTRLIEYHDQHIRAALQGLEADHKVFVTGCDWSLTGGMTSDTSVGGLIEQLSGVPFGAMGTLVAISELNKAIRAARVHLIGFSGVILPIIGDQVLAERNLQEPPSYRLRDLLSFSSVYGMGLDTIPLPGDSKVDQIVRILSEVAALAGSLRKPLIARLIPMPSLQARDLIDLDSSTDTSFAPFVFHSRVMELL